MFTLQYHKIEINFAKVISIWLSSPETIEVFNVILGRLALMLNKGDMTFKVHAT